MKTIRRQGAASEPPRTAAWKPSAANVIASGPAVIAYLAPLLLMILLFTRHFHDNTLGYYDADRILMDGVFIHDFIRAFPIFDPLGYALRYYIQYPVLSIGYRPPFFPFVEALFMLGFGIHIWVARLALIVMAVAGLVAWTHLLATMFDRATAAFSACLLVSLPFFAQWSWYPMAEIPTLSLVMVSACLLHAYVRTARAKLLYLATVAAALAVWTKPHAAFAVLWLPWFLLAAWPLREIIARREIRWSLLLAAFLMAPLALITLWGGDHNLHQITPSLPRSGEAFDWRESAIFHYPLVLFEEQLTVPVMLLSLGGFVWAVVRRDGRVAIFVLLIVAVYAVFSPMPAKEERYTIYWLPAFCLFAALPLHYARSRRSRSLIGAGLAATIVYGAWGTYGLTPNIRLSFEEAALYTLRHNRGPVIFVNSRNDGYFTYFVRKHDATGNRFVLRGNKLLTSSAVKPTSRLAVHARTHAEMREILSRASVSLIVTEARAFQEVETHREFQRYLRSDDFVLRWSAPIGGNDVRLAGDTLNIYEFVNPMPVDTRDLIMNLPVVGKRIVLPAHGSEPYIDTMAGGEG